MKEKPFQQADSEQLEDSHPNEETIQRNKDSKKIRKCSSSIKLDQAERKANQKYCSFRSFPRTLANSERSVLQVKRQDSFFSKSYIANDSFLQRQQNGQEKLATGLFKFKKPRSKNYIQISEVTKQRYLRVLQGSKDQTTQLNINIKTNIRNWFKKQTKFIDLSEDEIQLLQKFNQDSGCFQAFRNLFGCFDIQKTIKKQAILTQQKQAISEVPFKTYEDMQKFEESIFIQREKTKKVKRQQCRLFVSCRSDYIRKLFLDYMTSSSYLKSIFQSCRMIFFSKRVVLKYVQQTRMACISPQKFFSWKQQSNFL